MIKEILNIKSIIKFCAIFLGIYLLSFLGYVFPILNHLIFLAIIVTTGYLSYRKLDYGVYILLIELILGVRGYLFTFNIFGFALSLRIALFMVIFLIWFFKPRQQKFKFVSTKYFPYYLIFVLVLSLGLILGVVYGNKITNIFFDFNGYLFFGLAFIFFDAIDKKKLKNILQIIIVGSLAVSLFSLYCLTEFTIVHQESRPDMAEAISSELSIEGEEKEGATISHSTTAKNELLEYGFMRDFENKKPPIYRWVTDTGIGQISYLAGPFFRFFSAGQIFLLVGLGILLIYIIRTKATKNVYYISFVLISIYALTILLGFSRSLWLGLMGMVIFMLFVIPWKKSVRIILYGIGIISITIIIAGTLLPSFYDLVYERVDSIVHPKTEEAGQNRFNLIDPALNKIAEHPILGSGFGTTIEYESVVPEKYGTLRVFAFEWSYLDTITEIGVVGLFIYLILIFKVFKDGLKNKLYEADKILIIGLLTGLFGIIVANIATPYLNHPMGIGLIITIMLFTHILRNNYVKKKFQS